jgi:hypothetical protein
MMVAIQYDALSRPRLTVPQRGCEAADIVLAPGEALRAWDA